MTVSERVAPDLVVERRLRRAGATVLAAADEVGRGALCGPVTVGMVVLKSRVHEPPDGLRDSKLLTPAARAALVRPIRRWTAAHAVGHASAVELDAIGLTAALRLAANRALVALPSWPDVVLLDGNFDYLSPVRGPQTETLFDPDPARPFPRVRTQIKGDLTCASVAAASILAKTERDGLMDGLARHHPGYGWEHNRGYATPDHLEALRRLGPSPVHRQSWNLPPYGIELTLGDPLDWQDGAMPESTEETR